MKKAANRNFCFNEGIHLQVVCVNTYNIGPAEEK